jgi:NAD(P)-dependent dehydrogenase (short-subunit alcohol dehydrogenase family)
VFGVDLGLSGKTAYITGGAHGIGRAIVGRLVEEGVRVAVSDLDTATLDNEFKAVGKQVTTIQADLSTSQARDAAETAMDLLGGPPDILINNVGASHAKPFADITDDDWMWNFNLNFMSHVRSSQAIIPGMAAAENGGSVVFIASDLAKQPEQMPVEYATAKAGILSLTNVLSLTYAPRVRVNAVCPGPIWTDLWTKPGGVADGLSAAYSLSREDAVRRFVSERHLPLGIGEPDDVAAITVFLSSPLAKFITAAAFSVDGGGTRAML